MNKPTPSASTDSQLSDGEPGLSQPAGRRGSLGSIAARGMAWTFLSVVAGRITGLLTVLVLGRVLSAEDYGTYGIAAGLSVLVMTLRMSGPPKLLIQRGEEYDDLAQPIARLSWMINLTAMTVMWAIAPSAAAYYELPQLVPLMMIMGLALPLMVPNEVMRAKLSVMLRFREFAAVNASALITTQALTVIFALLGCGPFSFVYPTVIVTLGEMAVLYRLVGGWSRGRVLTRKLSFELLASIKWIVFCGFAAAVMNQGYQMVIGKLELPEVTGVFFFGFQLSATIGMFFSTGLHRVLMPTLARLNTDLDRQGQAYIKAIRAMVTIAAPVCLLATVSAEPLVHWLWNGKWDAAVPVVQFISATLPIYLGRSIGAALLESRGAWRTNTWVHTSNAVGTLLAAYLGAQWGGVWEIALVAASYRLCFGVVHAIFMTGLMSQPRRHYAQAVIPPCVVAVAAAAMVQWAADAFFPAVDESAFARFALIGMAYGAVITIAYALFFRTRVRELRTTVAR